MKVTRRSRDAAPARPALGDTIDAVVDQWAAQVPDLPVAPIEVVTRIGRLRTRFDDELAGLFAQFGLSAADFTVIAALRRSGEPYSLPQSSLMSRLGLTSGTVSVRLTRLVDKGVVTRSPSRDDARGTVVALTRKGLRLFDDVAPAHLRNEERLLSALTEAERRQLVGLLRRLLVGFEQEHWTSPLGMVLAPAHVARAMRTAVGLSDTPGLLVTEVRAMGAAADAGIQNGDLLVTLEGAELRSCVTLADRTAQAQRSASELRLGLLRGTRGVSVTIATRTS